MITDLIVLEKRNAIHDQNVILMIKDGRCNAECGMLASSVNGKLVDYKSIEAHV